MVEQAGIEGENASETPVDGRQFEGEVIFHKAGWLDEPDVVGKEIFKCRGIFVLENDRVGGMRGRFESVEAKARLPSGVLESRDFAPLMPA